MAAMNGTPEPAAHAPEARRHDLAATLTALLLGGAIVAFLTHYNLAGVSVWSAGPFRPPYSWEEYLVVNTAGLALLPLLAVLAGLREKPDAFGLAPPERGAGRIAWLFFAAMLPVVFVASLRPEFRQYYPIQPQAAYSWRYLLYFELTYGFYLFCWEWFYRGFLTFGLARRFGFNAAIVLQALAFMLMHWTKPMPEFFGSFVAGVALGWLAVRARSCIPGFAAHWAVAAAMDVLAIHAKPGALF
jgi:membrane protease YdiL (CAAX protease family)